VSTERIPALTALHDSAKPWRLEADRLLRLAINHKAATPFLGVARMDPRIYKSAAGDSRSIEFRIGEPDVNDTSDSSTLGFSIKHNASGELEIFASNGIGVKVAANGAITISGDTALNGNVTFGGAVPNPLPGYAKFLTGSLTHDPPSIAAGGDVVYDIPVPGLLLASAPAVLCRMSIFNANVFITNSWASTNDQVSFNYHNYSGSSMNLPSHTVRAYCWQL
jgi:hypothetical protein